ncbi:hypothetical protein [Vitiosangium sp. GDMCC 1.1324]|uniref:hypothetical protein n=1 Tax=Vitiosangium sp. (strain GDMCC 1.1324) TaxID=2138576 RepID=UPI000D3B31DB|nr:hypothetical protein [Vitiosangium sp. GDMCC 1.1324]PTL82762.1 hypothetical protein DAT35_18525 [Vitiosangium sp. GDMCC 1.1324]
MKRSTLVVLATLASSAALAQATDTSTASAPATQPQETAPTSPTGAQLPPPEKTESGKDTTTTKPEAKATSWTERVKLSGKAYLRYSYELDGPSKNANQFALDRLYLQGEYQLTDNSRFQVTLDAGDTRNSGTNSVFFAEAKYVFLELKNLLGAGSWLRAGMIPLAWVPYAEDLWGYRLQGPVALDRFGYIASSDLGLALGGALPSKHGSWQVNVNNGEGFRVAEIAKRKEVQARLTLNPLASMGGLAAGLFVTGYGSYGEYDDAGLGARVKSRVIGEIGLQSQPLTLAADYFVVRDSQPKVSGRFTVGPESIVHGQGLSVFGVLNVGAFAPAVSGLDLLARYDLLDPDTTLDHNDTRVLIAGVGYRFNGFVKGLVDYESQGYGADVGGPGTHKPTESRIKLQTEVRF